MWRKLHMTRSKWTCQVITKWDAIATTKIIHMVVQGNFFVAVCTTIHLSQDTLWHISCRFPSHCHCVHHCLFTEIIQVRVLLLKHISILEYISIPKTICGNIDYVYRMHLDVALPLITCNMPIPLGTPLPPFFWMQPCTHTHTRPYTSILNCSKALPPPAV